MSPQTTSPVNDHVDTSHKSTKNPLNPVIVSNIATPSSSQKLSSNDDPGYTPFRILQETTPILQKLIETRKRAKQVETLLTLEEHINVRKRAKEENLNKKLKDPI